MKISHESLANLPDLASQNQTNSSSTFSKLQTQPEQTSTITPAPQDPAILDHVLGTAPSLSDATDNLRNATDSLQEMSELQSLKLQQLMDNRSKFEETLSNIEKKQDDTASQILKNLKG